MAKINTIQKTSISRLFKIHGIIVCSFGLVAQFWWIKFIAKKDKAELRNVPGLFVISSKARRMTVYGHLFTHLFLPPINKSVWHSYSWANTEGLVVNKA